MTELPRGIFTANARRSLTPKQRAQLFLSADGKCCLCGGRIDGARERWIVEHLVPLADGGTNDIDNLAPAHEACAKPKTAREATGRARLKRAGMRHLGVKPRKSRPMPGSRASGWKKPMHGPAHRRDDD